MTRGRLATKKLFDDSVPVRAEALAGHADVRIDDTAGIQRIVGDEHVVLAVDLDDTRHRRWEESAARRDFRARRLAARVRVAGRLRRQKVDVIAARNAEVAR